MGRLEVHCAGSGIVGRNQVYGRRRRRREISVYGRGGLTNGRTEATAHYTWLHGAGVLRRYNNSRRRS